jgi:hypothetical protein
MNEINPNLVFEILYQSVQAFDFSAVSKIIFWLEMRFVHHHRTLNSIAAKVGSLPR